jgi:hypothetical protein
VLLLWVGMAFMTSTVTLHIATLLLLDNPSFAKAAAVAGSFWVVAFLFVAAHIFSGLLFSLVSVVIGFVVLKRLYGVGTGQALVIFFLSAIVEIAIGAVLWLAFPSLVGREGHRYHAAAGSGCSAVRARV